MYDLFINPLRMTRTLMKKYFLPLIIILSGCSTDDVKNSLLVTNNGWYLNNEHIQEFSDVKASLLKLPKAYLELSSCTKTEFEVFKKTIDFVDNLKIIDLDLNLNSPSKLCK